MCAKPIDLAVAINPVVAIVPTAQIFNDAILVAVMNGEYLPVVFGDSLRSEVYFCFCHCALWQRFEENASAFECRNCFAISVEVVRR